MLSTRSKFSKTARSARRRAHILSQLASAKFAFANAVFAGAKDLKKLWNAVLSFPPALRRRRPRLRRRRLSSI